MTPGELHDKRKHRFEYFKFEMKWPGFTLQKLLFLPPTHEVMCAGIKPIQWERKLLGGTFNLLSGQKEKTWGFEVQVHFICAINAIKYV